MSSDSLIVTLDSWDVLKVSCISGFRIKRFRYFRFPYETFPVSQFCSFDNSCMRNREKVVLLITEGVMDRRFKRTQRTKGSTLC